jgi:hypothetical protein
MTRWRQAERLRLGILVWMQMSLNLAVADDDYGEREAKQDGANSNHTREAHRLEHDVAEPGDLVGLDDFHYDWRAWRLHRSIVLHG